MIDNRNQFPDGTAERKFWWQRTSVAVLLAFSTLPLSILGVEDGNAKSLLSQEGIRAPMVESSFSGKQTAPEFNFAERRSVDIKFPDYFRVETEDKVREGISRPYKVGQHRDIPALFKGNLANQITWMAEDEGYSGSLTLYSPNAVGIRVSLTTSLPEDSRLILYELNEHGMGINPEDVTQQIRREGDNSNWLPTVAGERIAILFSVPSLSDVQIQLNQISHQFRSNKNSFNDGLDGCTNHINAVCSEIENAVPLMETSVNLVFEKSGGSFSCTGVLVANMTEGSFIPFIVTAKHCIENQSTADTVQVTWHFRTEDCDGKKIDSRMQRTSSGAYFLDSTPTQDISIIKLKTFHHSGTYFSGWSFTDDQIEQGKDVYTFHHPLGQEQKFSAGTINGLETIRHCAGEEEDDCELLRDGVSVSYSEGTTESGSSGTGLFVDSYLVGVLSSGSGGCDDTKDSYSSLNRSGNWISKWIADDNIDDHGNSKETATQIYRNSSVDGKIERSSDRDFFEFSVNHEGNVRLYTQSEIDTVGTLWGEKEIADDDDGGEGSNFEIEATLEPGTYHIEVKPYRFSSNLGDYEIVSEFELADIGDEWEESYVLDSPFDYVHAAIEKRADQDWYRILAPGKGTISVLTFGETDTLCHIRPSIQTGLDPISDDDGGIDQNCLLRLSVIPGIYYIVVEGHDENVRGEYQIGVLFRDADDHANEARYATDVSSTSDNWVFTTSAHLGTEDIDVFKISVQVQGRLRIASNSELDLVASLSDESEQEIAYDDDTGPFKNFELVHDIEPGVYYIFINGYHEESEGDYLLTVAFRETFYQN